MREVGSKNYCEIIKNKTKKHPFVKKEERNFGGGRRSIMREPLTKRSVRSTMIPKTAGKAIWRREKRTYILDTIAGAEGHDSYAGGATVLSIKTANHRFEEAYTSWNRRFAKYVRFWNESKIGALQSPCGRSQRRQRGREFWWRAIRMVPDG